MLAVPAERVVPVTRGRKYTSPQPPRKRKQLHYALAHKDGVVLLVQRPVGASLMAGMWELPWVSESQCDGRKPVVKVRHSITDTDYEVSVFVLSVEELPRGRRDGRWLSQKQWERLPITGLTRKILRRLVVESGGTSTESK